MAKVGSQSRLLIPQDLTKLAKIEQGEIGIFWDENLNTIYISNFMNRDHDYLVSIRKLDNKNRIVVSQNILDLIGANYSSELVIGLRRGRIYILNPKKT